MTRSRGRYDHEKSMRQQVREAQRRERSETASRRAAEREQKVADTEAGRARAIRLTDEVSERLDALENVLVRGLERDPVLDVRSLRRDDEPPPLDLRGRQRPVPAPTWHEPSRPRGVSGWFAGRERHESQVARARADFEQAVREHTNEERIRRRWVDEERARHAEAVRVHRAANDRHNEEITSFASRLYERDRESVQRYLNLVLGRTRLPDTVPQHAEVVYNSLGEQAVVQFDLPVVDVVPAVVSYTYVATTATMRTKARPAAQVALSYRSIVSQIALLYMRDLFESDAELDNVELSGHVRVTDPATGHPSYPCLISFGVDRAAYDALNLSGVTPERCLSSLGALVSEHPHLVEAVTPVRDFDLTRFAFTASVDVIAEMDSRTDLTAITPEAFEHFVRQLLEAQGLIVRTTNLTGDDGVDAVVVNEHSIAGGITVVQAKKYTRVLGPHHIRELVGAMDEKRAGNAVLITTAWFTSGCWTKAAENGRVQLIDGSGLRALAQQHLGMDVLVAPPTRRRRRGDPAG